MKAYAIHRGMDVDRCRPESLPIFGDDGRLQRLEGEAQALFKNRISIPQGDV